MKKNSLLQISILMLILVALSINIFISFDKNKKSEINKLSQNLRNQLDMITRDLEIVRQGKLEKVKNDLKVASFLLNQNSKLTISKEETINTIAINQITKEKHNVLLKKWYLRETQIQSNFEFVNKFHSLTSSNITIFQKIDKGFLRVSTSILKQDGKPAVGTYIPNSSKLIKAIMKGETYYGRAYVINDWYLTAYEPIKVDGKIVGILHIAVKEKNIETIKNMILKTTLANKAYIEVFDYRGNVILHENKGNKTIPKEYMLESGSDYKEGKLYVYKKFNNFRWYILITTYIQ